MKRIKLVIGVAAIMAMMIMAAAAPAMAMENHSNGNHPTQRDVRLERADVRLDRSLLRDNLGFIPFTCDNNGAFIVFEQNID